MPDELIYDLKAYSSISVLSCPENPRLLQDFLLAHAPDWLVVGAKADDFDVHNAFSTTHSTNADLKLAILGDPEDQARCRRWLQRGCSAYLASSVESRKFLNALSIAHQGFMVVDEVFRSDSPTLSPGERLTRREHEVLNLLSGGLSNDQIARVLSLSRSTIEFHLKRIYGKLKVNNRVEATAHANGLRI
ncbi:MULTISPECIES: response regulator transcription factor [unclassified Amycolatopsis]|uniref:helix-turn-helix transcriptional regulator n=1 Tax=unclassified Amycolatopsis TaxID=2618356 RepID=UPI001431F8A6|nr:MULTISPECIES: response regulator transcription factor [unclassified Amycolatopsis]